MVSLWLTRWEALTLLNYPIFFLTSSGFLSMERALIDVPQLQTICYGVLGKMALAQAAWKNKQSCHTQWVMSSFLFWLESYLGRLARLIHKLCKDNLQGRGKSGVKRCKESYLKTHLSQIPTHLWKGAIPQQQYILTHTYLQHVATASDLWQPLWADWIHSKTIYILLFPEGISREE